MFLLREGVVIKHYFDDTLFFCYPNVCCRMLTKNIIDASESVDR